MREDELHIDTIQGSAANEVNCIASSNHLIGNQFLSVLVLKFDLGDRGCRPVGIEGKKLVGVSVLVAAAEETQSLETAKAPLPARGIFQTDWIFRECKRTNGNSV